ncbi:protein SOSEKI 5-like [Rhodamnia argentea]|uniref:Protein SOSEKI 5-like n=1 Tax=Rhodamnia argentea TaxID=178133 RepID=A0A8B8MNY2_9MYRT|nr:protein SOSEKI 5-like [Rhodamnia argentea]
MSVGSRYNKADVWVPRKFQDTGTSPESTKKWIEPRMKMESKVPVVYYLSRNGHLEHPHFMEVRLSSPGGLFLRDVTNRLNCLRGQGMANMYSWSSKRTYRSGYVWQDLTEDDLIHPCNGREYILKGSELLQVPSPSLRSSAAISSPTAKNGSSEANNPAEVPKLSDIIKIEHKNQLYPTSLSLDDVRQYIVYKAKTSEKANKAANASTQTDDKRTRLTKRGDRDEDWSNEEIRVLSSPPPSNSSTEGRESLDGSSSTRRDPTYKLSDIRNQALENERPSGRMKASAAVLRQLIMCGAKGVDDVQSITPR